jgi:hypothetical protein
MVKLPKGRLFRAGRVLAGLTIEDLAAVAGIDPGSVVRLETDRVVSNRMIELISETLEKHGVRVEATSVSVLEGFMPKPHTLRRRSKARKTTKPK